MDPAPLNTTSRLQQAEWLQEHQVPDQWQQETVQWVPLPPDRPLPGEGGAEDQEVGGAEGDPQPRPGEEVQAELSSPPETTAGVWQSRHSEEEPGGGLAPGPGHLLHQQSPEEEAQPPPTSPLSSAHQAQRPSRARLSLPPEEAHGGHRQVHRRPGQPGQVHPADQVWEACPW